MRKSVKFIFSTQFLCIFLIAAQVAAIIFLCIFIPSFLPVGVSLALFWLLTLPAAVCLFVSDAPPESKSATFLLFCALPVISPLIYYIFSIGSKKCARLTLLSDDGNAAFAGFPAAVETGYQSCEYFTDGTRFFNALFEKISRAKKSVYLEFYIISRGKIYSRLVSALRAAKENGADIKIICDGFGSSLRLGRREMKELKGLGEVKRFNRLTPLPYSRHNRRDHRKIAVIDSTYGFTGGINIADEYANIDSNYGYWKDSAIFLCGNAALALEAMFLSVWKGEYTATIPCGGERKCVLYCDAPPAHRFCEESYAAAIHSARDRVHILTPYFCPGEKLFSALSFAARRGVDVKIILPHIPDNRYVHAVSRAFAEALARSGVKFYEFTPGFMHSKCVIFDNAVCLGSYNFDLRSMRTNYECGAILGGKTAADVERDFADCLALSAPLLHGKPTPAARFKRFILKLFSPLI